MPMTLQVLLSVVAPCFNEATGLAEFHRRVTAACHALPGLLDSWELVLINDGSRDTTREVMQKLAWQDPHVVAINLARNYGHQVALTAGLQHCRGERILVIDADLQDPPELLTGMMQVMDSQDADVVYGQRRARAGETRLKLTTAALFYRALRRLVDIDIPLDTGDFRLMNRRTLDVLNQMPERDRFIRGLVSWIGLRQVPFAYDRDARFAGSSNYPILKMIRFALDAVTSFSVLPLRFASLAGAISGTIGLLALSYTVGGWLFGSVVTGWTSLATLVLIIGGVQLLMLGIIGEYLGRLYMETKRRPLFVVDNIVHVPAGASPRVHGIDQAPVSTEPVV
jgi:dolichol-phosphate mannosyltransferase